GRKVTATTTDTSHDQHFAVRHPRSRLSTAPLQKTPSSSPGSGAGIINFRRRLIQVLGSKTAGDEDLSAGQQRRRMIVACDDQIGRARPGPAHRIVEFRRAKRIPEGLSSSDQHLAIRQKCCRMKPASLTQASGASPSSSDWVVEFSALKGTGGADAT